MYGIIPELTRACLSLNHLIILGKYFLYGDALNAEKSSFIDFKRLVQDKIERKKAYSGAPRANRNFPLRNGRILHTFVDCKYRVSVNVKKPYFKRTYLFFVSPRLNRSLVYHHILNQFPRVRGFLWQKSGQISHESPFVLNYNFEANSRYFTISGSSNKQGLQTSLEAGLRLADTHNLRSVSIPSVGTGGFGLTAADSAQITFQALNNFRGNCKSVRKVRVVVFQAPMMQVFLQAQQSQAVDDPDSDSSSEEAIAAQPTKRRSMSSVTNDASVKLFVTGKDKSSVEKAVDSLKKGFSEACTTQPVENDAVSQLSHKQIGTLKKKAIDRDVRLVIEAAVDRIVVRGDPTEVTGMVGEIWHELNERNNKIQEEQQALLVSKNIEWSYDIQGAKMLFGPKTNAKIEMAYTKEQSTVQILLRGDEFVIDLKAKTGRGQRNNERITLSRKVKGAKEGKGIVNAMTSSLFC